MVTVPDFQQMTATSPRCCHVGPEPTTDGSLARDFAAITRFVDTVRGISSATVFDPR
jgi:hypothetical protein